MIELNSIKAIITTIIVIAIIIMLYKSSKKDKNSNNNYNNINYSNQYKENVRSIEIMNESHKEITKNDEYIDKIPEKIEKIDDSKQNKESSIYCEYKPDKKEANKDLNTSDNNNDLNNLFSEEPLNGEDLSWLRKGNKNLFL